MEIIVQCSTSSSTPQRVSVEMGITRGHQGALHDTCSGSRQRTLLSQSSSITIGITRTDAARWSSSCGDICCAGKRGWFSAQSGAP